MVTAKDKVSIDSIVICVMEALYREFRFALSQELLYVHVLVVVAETEDDVIERLNERKNNVENTGTRVTHTKHTTIYGSQDFVWEYLSEPVPEETKGCNLNSCCTTLKSFKRQCYYYYYYYYYYYWYSAV